MLQNPRVVVFGGTGHFGARICRRLARKPELDLVVTSRTLSRAELLVAAITREEPAANVSAAALDQDAPGMPDELARLDADVVIHTAGPYQGQDYRVAEACVSAGSHYVDLADGREFVSGFDRLDAAAKRAGVTLVSGASTLPGLSSAVVDEYRGHFSQIERVAISIAPAHRTPRGVGTARAVLSYCGVPLQTWSRGEWRTLYGWQDLTVQRYPQFGRRLSGACDVPDLALFPDYVPGLQTVSFHAALEAPWEQMGLWLMAWLKRWHLVKDWARYASTFTAISDRLQRFGSDRGGMHMHLSGADGGGQPRCVDWYLVAEENHGPEIPCTPAIVVALKIIGEQLVAPGALACLGLFSVAEFMDELADFRVTIDVHE
jgi:hypothetical protein